MNQPKKRILVVDDEPSVTRLLKLNLEQTNDYEVITENSPTHAFRTARSTHPDLILLDVLMPGKDGSMLASDFQSSTDFANVPIVFLTAAVTRDEVNLNHGVIGGLPFLAKPVHIQEVVTCLRQHLGTPPATNSTHCR